MQGRAFHAPVPYRQIDEAKELMTEKENPRFGVDLAIPQLGGSARKTNHDYSHGKLPELIDIIIAEKARPAQNYAAPRSVRRALFIPQAPSRGTRSLQ